MKIKVHDGLLFEWDPLLHDQERMIDAPEADRIASANGFTFAEQFVKAYEGETLELHADGLIFTKL